MGRPKLGRVYKFRNALKIGDENKENNFKNSMPAEEKDCSVHAALDKAIFKARSLATLAQKRQKRKAEEHPGELQVSLWYNLSSWNHILGTLCMMG